MGSSKLPIKIHFAYSIVGIVSGVYKIYFGKKYYIGRSVDMVARVNKHCQEINYHLQLKILKPQGSYRNIKNHLIKYPSISVATVTILKICVREELQKIEYNYLKKALRDKNCLNAGFGFPAPTPAASEQQKKTKKFLERRRKKLIPKWEKENQQMFAHLNLSK